MLLWHLAPFAQRLPRLTALELFTHGSAWFSSEQGKKGLIKVGQLADLAALSADFFSVEEEAIKQIEAVLTVVGGQGARALAAWISVAGPGPSMQRRLCCACP